MKSNFTNNANSTDFTWPGGVGVFAGSGTFGSGTLSLQRQMPDASWMTLGSGANTAALTSNGSLKFTEGVGVQLRLNLAGATSPTISAEVRQAAASGLSVNSTV